MTHIEMAMEQYKKFADAEKIETLDKVLELVMKYETREICSDDTLKLDASAKIVEELIALGYDKKQINGTIWHYKTVAYDLFGSIWYDQYATPVKYNRYAYGDL